MSYKRLLLSDYYDDLPIWGFIGKVEKDSKSDPSEYKYYLYKHINFEILYNKDRVIEINVRTDPNALVDLTEDKPVDAEFMYIVKWKETTTPFDKRMDKFSQSSSLPHHLEIHWFSIINSCLTVLLLTGLLSTILMRVLKNDFVKYAHDEEAADDQEETGWKYIHGDAFRYPKGKSLFAAALGSGTQLFALTIFVFILALVGVFYPYNRARRNKLGEEYVVDRVALLRSFVPDLLLPQHSSYCLQCDCCTTIWNDCGYSSHLDFSNFTFAGIGWNCGKK
ncbi:hypothetical protein MKX01_032350 [Papaver californicum]|nr:hypothetical protein MKX01_032350 [Papaver californicum]